MEEFGTGLRAHLEQGRERPTERSVETTFPVEAVARELESERRRLETVAAALAGKELELAQREAELDVTEERLALTLAKALIQAAQQANLPPPLDELAVARARRFS
jgi:hypothetical protein